VTKIGNLTHIAGTFLIQADGAFLNGAGLGDGEDRNVTIPKTFRDGRGEVPYVSAQAWKRWLRTTAVEEAGWQPSLPQAIGWNPKGNVNQIAGQLNPVEFPEDDIFGYMRAQEGQGRRKVGDQDADDDDEENGDTKTRSVMRASPFAASLLMSLRSVGWRGEDEGFVHLTKFDPDALAEAEVGRFISAVKGTTAKGTDKSAKQKDRDVWKDLENLDKDKNKEFSKKVKALAEKHDLDELRNLLAEHAKEEGKDVTFIQNATSPLPYTTRFYNTNLQAIFSLNYSRLGVFWNIGDRIELEGSKAKEFLKKKMIKDVTNEKPYNALSGDGALGKIYKLIDQNERKNRAGALLTALSVLRGGAKQAQFGTDVAPKALVLAGLNCGNPIFNHLFRDNDDGLVFKVDALSEIVADYSDRIVTPVFIGVRAGYLKNEAEIGALAGRYQVQRGEDGKEKLSKVVNLEDQAGIEIRVTTPLDAAKRIGELLP
jgi:CRISPR-associated protein Cst2